MDYPCRNGAPRPNPIPNSPRSAGLGISGEAPPRDLVSLRPAPPPATPFSLRRPIRILRLPLDLGSFRSEPPDPKPAAEIQTYRFGLDSFLKSPCTFCYSTRSPPPLKNNYSLAQDFAQTPLSFLNFKPAVQHSFFYALDPRINVYLRFSPRF